MPGTDVGPVRQKLSGGPLECQEGAPSMDPARENTKESGGGPTIVINVLSVSGAGGIDFWGGNLGVVGGNVLEAGGSAHGITKTDDGA